MKNKNTFNTTISIIKETDMLKIHLNSKLTILLLDNST